MMMMNLPLTVEVQVVMKEKDRKWIMEECVELLSKQPNTTKSKEFTKLLTYNPRYAVSIPIYEFWDEELKCGERTFKKVEELSRGYEYTARYREIVDEKE